MRLLESQDVASEPQEAQSSDSFHFLGLFFLAHESIDLVTDVFYLEHDGLDLFINSVNLTPELLEVSSIYDNNFVFLYGFDQAHVNWCMLVNGGVANFWL